MITDFMGDDTALEEDMLRDAGIDTFVSPSAEEKSWIAHASTADAVLTRHARIDATAISQLRHCRIIARYGTGFDNIDVDAAGRNGILVTVVPDFSTEEVANHALTLILMCIRQIRAFSESMTAGRWTLSPLPRVPRVSRLTLGLLGCGRIGASLANRAITCGFSVAAYDPHITDAPHGVSKVDSLEHLITSSDVLSIHAPLTSETRGILNADRLRGLRRGSVVVNVARGGLLDLDAAAELLADGHLGGLALDVFDPEPLPPGHRLRTMDGVILTPHVGYYSIGSLEEAKKRSVSEIIRVLKGESPRHPVLRGL